MQMKGFRHANNEYCFSTAFADDITDLTIFCKDGLVNSHQMILGMHSKFLKQLFLSQHQMEFSMVDWEHGVAQLTGRRSSVHMDVYLPDFSRDDFKRFLYLFYKGEVIIENEVQSSILKDLFKTLQIDSVKLSSLNLTEKACDPVGFFVPESMPTPSPEETEDEVMQSTSRTPSRPRPGTSTTRNSIMEAWGRPGGSVTLSRKREAAPNSLLKSNNSTDDSAPPKKAKILESFSNESTTEDPLEETELIVVDTIGGASDDPLEIGI